MLVGSVVNGLNSSGGFCAGSHIVVDHLRIDGTSFTFSAAVVALLAVSASEGINIHRNTVSDAVHPVKHLTGPSGPYWTASRRSDHDSLDSFARRRLADIHITSTSTCVLQCSHRRL